MPVIWKSSTDPMYVRTVWVHGIRHAILTRDDPYFKRLKAKQWRPYSSKSYKTTTPRNSPTRTNSREKINLIVTNARDQSSSTRSSSVLEGDIEKLDLSEIDNAFEEEFIFQVKSIRLRESENFSSRVKNLFLDMKSIKSNSTFRVETNEITELSDRVMQWLDLAGKIDLLKPENDSRLALPRHSWPGIQKKIAMVKPKPAVEIKAKLESTKEPLQARVDNIDRFEYHVPMPSNTIENYARQSRNVKISARNDTSKLKDSAKKTKDTHVNLQETRNKVVSERKAVEKQYADLVSKKIVPDYKAKKQVHIFMPAVPKKVGSNMSSVASSLLSKVS